MSLEVRAFGLPSPRPRHHYSRISVFLCPTNIPLCIHTTFLSSFIVGHLGCFRFLVIANNAPHMCFLLQLNRTLRRCCDHSNCKRNNSWAGHYPRGSALPPLPEQAGQLGWGGLTGQRSGLRAQPGVCQGFQHLPSGSDSHRFQKEG